MHPQNPLPDRKNRQAFDLVQKVLLHHSSRIPFVLGITGAGGAGKTTFALNLVKYYGNDQCTTIDLDDYLLPRDMRGKLGITGYNPQANHLFDARAQIQQLKAGITITKPRYNHATGTVENPEQISPQQIIVVEGVTTLYPELAELYHVSFFLDAHEQTQIKSRIARDVKKRGYTLEEALTLYQNLKPDYEKHIAPTRKHASVVFEVSPDYIMHPIHIDRRLDTLLYDKDIGIV